MTITIQNHPNYGLDVHAVQKEMSITLSSKIRLLKVTVQTLNRIRKEIGLRRLVVCHYNLPQFFTKKYCAADDTMFKRAVEQAGAACVILHEDESVNI